MPAPKNLGDHIGEQVPLCVPTFLRDAKPSVIAVLPELLHRCCVPIVPNDGVWVFKGRFLALKPRSYQLHKCAFLSGCLGLCLKWLGFSLLPTTTEPDWI